MLVATIGLVLYFGYVVSDNGAAAIISSASPAFRSCRMLAFQAADIYQVQAFRGHEKQYMRLASAWSVVFLLAISRVVFRQGRRSVLPRLARQLLRRRPGHADRISARVVSPGAPVDTQGRLDRRTVVVGAGDSGEALIAAMAAQRDSDVRVIGVFDDRGDERCSADRANGVPKLGTVDDLVEFARHTRVDLVIFSLPISAEGRILQMLKKLWVLPVDIRLAAHTNKLRFRPRSYSYIGNVPVLDIFDRPIADWDVVMKWLFDKIVGTLALICACAGHACGGARHQARQQGPDPVQAAPLRLQQRSGRGLQIPLDVCRAHRRGGEQARHQRTIRASPASAVSSAAPALTSCRSCSTSSSPAICRWSARGRMPLHAKADDHLYDEAVDGYFARHRVKPGITGWAQINGWRGETDSKEKIQRRVEHDLYYIENWSILFDIYILARTPFALLRGERRVLIGLHGGTPHCSAKPRQRGAAALFSQSARFDMKRALPAADTQSNSAIVPGSSSRKT